jgi:hypothetical protein
MSEYGYTYRFEQVDEFKDNKGVEGRGGEGVEKKEKERD